MTSPATAIDLLPHDPINLVLMTLGAVILFNVVATLGGGADSTLAVGATTLGDGGSSGASRCPVMMAVRF